MSTPKNHHYVSQCHQKEFFNRETGLIYLYDKELDNHYSKRSTKGLFSEDFLNTRKKNGRIDHSSLETELKILFEDNFLKHINTVKIFITTQSDIQSAYEALCWLTMLGILGELRNPNFKKSLDKTFGEIETDLFSKITGFEKEAIKNYIQSKKQTPYDNVTSYVEIALRILEKMEPIDFLICHIESNDHFILPDTSSYQIRGQLKYYPNPYIREIVQVGIPLTDKIFILATSRHLKTELHGIQFIRDDNSELVLEINKDLFGFSKKTVACKDEEFLRKTVEKIKVAQNRQTKKAGEHY